MTRWPRFAARTAMITLALAFAATAAPLAAQQNQTAEPVATSQNSVPAAAPQAGQDAAPTQAAGPRVNNSMERVQPKFASAHASSLYQDNVYVNRSYLIYILVAAILVVLLVILIKRA